MITNYDAFIAHLKRTGRIKLLPQILRELRTEKARQALGAPVVEVANAKEGETALRAAARQGVVSEQVIVNTSLISGWRAHAKGMLIDRSAKRMLVDIYKNSIA